MGSCSVLYRLYRFCVPLLRGAGAPLGWYIPFGHINSLTKKILIDRLTASGRSFSFHHFRAGRWSPFRPCRLSARHLLRWRAFLFALFFRLYAVSRLNAVYLRFVCF